MRDHRFEVVEIESQLKQWFPHAFIRAARIAAYPILPDEQNLVAQAITRRQDEFSTGRWLARQGLQHFGLPDLPVLIGRLRNPLWPSCVTGSITHDGGLCAVALLQKEIHPESGIGIDLVALSEHTENMHALLPLFMTHEGELDAMKSTGLSVDPALQLFSFKESVIKALSFQLTDFIDMRDIEIHYSNTLQCKVFGQSVHGELFSAATDHCLLTAASVLN